MTEKQLMSWACEELGHRQDTPCQASLENLLRQAIEQLTTARVALASRPSAGLSRRRRAHESEVAS